MPAIERGRAGGNRIREGDSVVLGAPLAEHHQAIDKASPRVQLHVLGKTTEGRPFLAVFFSDPATRKNLEHYRSIQHQLMDPRARGSASVASPVAQGKNAVMVTSINPDGVDIVGNWHKQTLGTAAEGTSPPEPYHKYFGHDDNRDWYAFTQVETRYTIDSLYGRWDPEIVNDIHQQGGGARRIVIPPYMDPVDPNIDPTLTSGTNEMGMAMTWKMIAEGFTGVANNASYDQWSPARQYSLYHCGIRILTETASARLPTSYATLGDRAMDADHPWTWDTIPSAYIIPRQQADPTALQRILWTLQHGQVEVRQTTAPVTVEGRTVPAGSSAVAVRREPRAIHVHRGSRRARGESRRALRRDHPARSEPAAARERAARALPRLAAVGVAVGRRQAEREGGDGGCVDGQRTRDPVRLPAAVSRAKRGDGAIDLGGD